MRFGWGIEEGGKNRWTYTGVGSDQGDVVNVHRDFQ